MASRRGEGVRTRVYSYGENQVLTNRTLAAAKFLLGGNIVWLGEGEVYLTHADEFDIANAGVEHLVEQRCLTRVWSEVKSDFGR